MEKRKLREGWYGADTEVEFDDSVFGDIKKYFKLPEDVEILNAYYFVDEVTVDYEDANGKMDTIDMHVPIGIVEEWFKAGYTILDESIKKPQVKKSNLTERFMSIHEKPATRFNKNLKKVYEMLDKYGTKYEDVDKVFNRASLKERLEMVKLLKEGMEVKIAMPKKKLEENHPDWNDKMPGYYGESIFGMLDEMSGDQIQMFMNEYDLWEPLNLSKGASTDSIYDAINRYLDTDPGYGLYRKLSNFN